MKVETVEKLIEIINNKNRDVFEIYKDKGFINLINLYRETIFEKTKDENLYNLDLKDINRVEFKSFDSKNLVGIYHRNKKKTKNWIIACHGFSSSKESSFVASYYFNKLGYNIFSFDFRNHGESDYAPTTMGIHEEFDLMSAINYVIKKLKASKIGLIGFSMGAQVVNRFALSKNIKKSKVKFIVSDSTYFDVKEILDKNIKNATGPIMGKVFINALQNVYKTYKEKYDIDVDHDSLTYRIAKCKHTIPILYFHSKEDKITNYTDSEKFYNLRKIITDDDIIHIFQTGEHIKLQLVHKNMYWKLVEEFANKHF